jgi:hypothetical protein
MKLELNKFLIVMKLTSSIMSISKKIDVCRELDKFKHNFIGIDLKLYTINNQKLVNLLYNKLELEYIQNKYSILNLE